MVRGGVNGADHGALGAVVGVANATNPLYGVGVTGANVKIAVEHGDVEAAAEGVTKLVLTGVTAVVAATAGGAPARGPPATLELALQVQGNTPVWHQAVTLLETAEGPTLVAGGETDLSAAQKALAGSLGLTPVPDLPGAHAEQTAIQGAAVLGLTPTKGVVTV